MTTINASGLGGGGAMYVPVVSPHDPYLRFVSCDMGGLYRSVDAGANWILIDGHAMQGDTRCPVVFDPSQQDTIYAFGGERSLRRSSDRGDTWSDIPLPISWLSRAITALAIDPSARLFVGTRDDAHFLDASGWHDLAGVTGRVVGLVLTSSDHFVATATGIYKGHAALTIWSPTVNGLPNPLPSPTPGIDDDTSIRSIAGGRDSSSGQTVLYVTMPSVPAGNAVVDGAVYVSTNGGTSWGKAYSGLEIARGAAGEACEFPQYERLAVHPSDPNTAYVSICLASPQFKNYRLYKTTNAGVSWVHVLNVDASVPSTPSNPNVTGGWQDFPLFGWGNTGRGRGLGAGISTRSGDHSVFFTNNGVLYQSEDGGTNWQQAYTELWPYGQGKPGSTSPSPQTWRSIGLEVTTTWRYVVPQDIFPNDDPALHFICYTDICFARSVDSGRSWYPMRPNTLNTIYEIAFNRAAASPAPGAFREMWAAGSNHHDLPYWDHMLDDKYITKPTIWSGEVLRSTDGGATWQTFGTNLPAGGAVSIASDDRTPPNLWAAVWGSGVYQYNRSNGAWEARNTNLGIAANKHIYRLQWEPDSTVPSGRLYCLIAGRRINKTQSGKQSDAFLDDPGGIWLSTDGGLNWTNLTPVTSGTALYDAMRHPRDFALDPNNKNIMYICAADVPEIKTSGGQVLQAGRGGSLWKTTNGGQSWSEVTSFAAAVSASGYYFAVRPFAPFIDPHKPNKVWMSTEGSGLWVTEDITAPNPTWVSFKNLPFMSIQRLRFAPGNDPAIMISTFGAGILELQRECFWIDNRSAFSEYEVGTPTPASPARFGEAAYMVFDGFLPSEIDPPTNPQLTLTNRQTGMQPSGFKLTNPHLIPEDPQMPYQAKGESDFA